jgi:ABC-type branched-subunit amino acid transport system substrate-binding protein
MTSRVVLALAAATLALPAAVQAEEPFRIGSSVGLTGYAAANDRAWRDGLMLAADTLNAKGGLLGRKIELVIEDNRSEPQEAVIGYRKMLASDKVQLFDSGCVSAGNFAAASFVVKAQIPMMLCSILPPRPEEQKWAFSVLAPPRFEVEARFEHLRDKTQIRKVGILHDPTPYALLTKDIATKIAKDFGLEVAGVETYRPDDADLSVQIGRLNGAGAGAIVKLGQGGSTVTAAKNIRQLGLDKLLLMASIDNWAVFRGAGESLGDRFLYVAPPVQLPEALSDPQARKAVEAFLSLWQARHGDADPYAAARAWDSMMLIAQAVEAAKSADGTAIRDAIEKLSTYQGAAASYSFSPEQHFGIVKNPLLVGTIAAGKLVLVN